MITTLVQHGDGYALIIDRAILELLNITLETPLDVSTDGESLTITPVLDNDRCDRVEAALQKTNQRYGRALKRLAE